MREVLRHTLTVRLITLIKLGMASINHEIETFIAANNMGAATFGHLAMGDRHLVRQIRAGRRLWPETEAKVRAFMARYPPPTEPAASPASEEA